MLTLYATDLDGTLLNSEAKLSATTAQGLNRLYEAGVPVTLVTARTPATVQPIMHAALPRIPSVVMTGAALWHANEERYECVAYHHADDVHKIIEICHNHGVTPFIYTLPTGSNSLQVYHHASLLTPIEEHFVADRTLNHLKTFHLNNEMPDQSAADVVLFFAMGNPDAIKAVAEDIMRLTNCYASCYPDTYNKGLALLEVFTSGVSKGAALRRLKDITQADRIVAFGDNLNDLPMLREADVAIAVENAHPEVKKMADIVIGPNTSDSVVNYIISQEL